MRRRLAVLGLAAAVVAGAVHAARNGDGDEAEPWTAAELEVLRSLSLSSLPAAPPPDPSNRYADSEAAATLGRALFFETRLSANGEVSCASCHLPARGFQDDRALARGLATTTRRTMPIVALAGQTWFFWDGRKDSLWSQALAPLENPEEQGLPRAEVVRRVLALYRREYEAAFGPVPSGANRIDRVFANVGKAIAAYERRLRLGPARFDAYVAAALDGDERSMARTLSPREVAGLRLFIGRAGCTQCHSGPLLTNGELHRTGVPPSAKAGVDEGRAGAIARLVADEFNCLGPYSDAPPNECAMRFVVRDRERTLGAFKTPSRRNVTRRAPYMHAGQLETLREVLAHYDRAPAAPVGRCELHPLGLTDSELGSLEAFLATLESPIVAPPGWLRGQGQGPSWPRSTRAGRSRRRARRRRRARAAGTRDLR